MSLGEECRSNVRLGFVSTSTKEDIWPQTVGSDENRLLSSWLTAQYRLIALFKQWLQSCHGAAFDLWEER